MLPGIVSRLGWIGTALLILAILYTMYFARALLLPIFLAVLLSMVLSPFVRGLNRLMIPKFIGAALVVVSLLAVLAFAALKMSGPAGAWIERVPLLRLEIQTKINTLHEPLAKAQEATESLEKITSGGEEKPQVVVEGPSLTERIFAEAQTAVISLTVVVVLVYFLLARGDRSFERIMAAIKDREKRETWKGVFHDIQGNIARYLLTIALINTVLGVLTALAMFALGMPNPALWGILAGALNFIPYAGPLVTIGVIGTVSLLSFDDWAWIVLPPAVFMLFTALEGQIISPTIVGRRLTLDPIAVFLSILFWGWLWGLAGMLLAVPILASIRIALSAVEPIPPLGAFIGDDHQGPGDATQQS